MLAKAQIKYIQSLKIKKYRRQFNCFAAEGTKTVLELLNSKMTVNSIYATAKWLEEYNQFAGMATAINEYELKKISSQKTPQEVLGLFEIPNPVPDPNKVTNNINLVLDDIRDPGNLGTIIRIADWFGIPYIFCSPWSADAFNPKVIQASMGSIARVQVIYQMPQEVFNQYPALHIYGADMKGDNIFTMDLPKAGFLVIGNESVGINEAIRPYINHLISIPSAGGAESLNAAVATGIICAVFKSAKNKL